jgi:hypothetical protein
MFILLCEFYIISKYDEMNCNLFFGSFFNVFDALPSPGVNPLEGSPKCSCEKLGLGRRSRLPTLERGRGSSWEPRD